MDECRILEASSNSSIVNTFLPPLGFSGALEYAELVFSSEYSVSTGKAARGLGPGLDMEIPANLVLKLVVEILL